LYFSEILGSERIRREAEEWWVLIMQSVVSKDAAFPS
jgi:hypothetical protein